MSADAVSMVYRVGFEASVESEVGHQGHDRYARHSMQQFAAGASRVEDLRPSCAETAFLTLRRGLEYLGD